MTKDYTLHAGTVNLIKQLLGMGGWPNQIVDVYNAGKLIETLPDIAGPTKEDAFASVTITLSDKQLATVLKSVNYHVEKGVVLPSPFATQLFEAFELV